MSAALALPGASGFWNNLWPRENETAVGVIATARRPTTARMYDSVLVFHAPSDLAVEPVMEGGRVRAITRPAADLNESVIAALYVGATGGADQPAMAPLRRIRPDPQAEQAQMRVARLTDIQVSFALPLQTLAEMLHVSRPQLYKWLDVSQLIRLQAESADRLAAVEQLAQKWSARTTGPLAPWLRERVDDNHSLLDLLTQAKLNVAQIEQAFDAVVRRIQDAPKLRAQRLREAGFARRPTHRSLPTDE